MKNNLATLRTNAGITQKALSDTTGIPVRTLQDWELGKRTLVDINKIRILCSALGCTIDELVPPMLAPKKNPKRAREIATAGYKLQTKKPKE